MNDHTTQPEAALHFRPARAGDLGAVAEIYALIHEQERLGAACIGWQAGVYPTRATAEAALSRGELFVAEREGAVIAAAILNQAQLAEYALGQWRFPARNEEVAVLHTLVVHPACGKSGVGRRFVAYFEQWARAQGCRVARLDTNERNRVARRFYASLGYREAGIVPCTFNGIPGVQLVLLEKGPLD